MSGKKYFYAVGQRARAKGMSKIQAEEFYNQCTTLRTYCI